ncbi:hypothetical protein Nocox_33565 [Nonomuraea coxensis DSM 45129]|uniref:EfeO-type cupredoxin-like domain-containing protein n=1 Tax=Nonomuraea coxensis DSM 45129 TaxID=1122611 RepID=A0ABX8U972_9ACTN|nr:hypothetical protein [Nonomuraea coxensis]QYC44283.1 hypothetical protein Nocox_33565 [Nonomuraea coxensis DSM 45129]
MRRPHPYRLMIGTAAAVLLLGACGQPVTTHHRPGTDHAPATAAAGTPHVHGDHQTRDVPATEAPSVRLEMRPDSESGWNLHLVTDRFTFTPDSVGGAALPGTGHAHLYLDGKKIARLYAPWHHLAAEAVPAGTHTLTVRLSADDHTLWSSAGKPVESSATIEGPQQAAKGTATAATPAIPDTPTTQGTAASRPTRIDVRISGRTVTPPPGRVEIEEGAKVRLEVTADRTDTVHVHGFDLERPLTPGIPAVIEFTADRSGLFEVETHESGLVLTQLVVR